MLALPPKMSTLMNLGDEPITQVGFRILVKTDEEINTPFVIA
jgi:hypothetical protein